MAFHLHLINSLWDLIPAAAPKMEQDGVRNAHLAPQLLLRWELEEDGRPHARWIRD